MDYRESHGVEYRGQWFVRVFIERRLPVKSVQPRFDLFDRSDLWVCRKNTNIRGHEYTYSVNLRNGSTGPARLACEGVKPLNVSPMEPRARMGPNGIRPPMMRVDPDAK